MVSRVRTPSSQHLEGVQQLGAEHVLAAAEIGLRGERLDRRSAASGARRRPSRGPRSPARTGAARRCSRSILASHVGVLWLQQRLALLGEPGEVGRHSRYCGRRLGELGLALHLALAGQHQVGQRQVGLDAAQGGIERGARDAHAPAPPATAPRRSGGRRRRACASAPSRQRAKQRSTRAHSQPRCATGRRAAVPTAALAR